MGEPVGLHLSRLGVGSVAGLVVAIVKFKGIDVEYATKLAAMDWAQYFIALASYSFLPVLLGAIGGWISDEKKVHKIFWFALTAPVILTAAAGEVRKSDEHHVSPGKAGWNLEQLLPVSSAYGSPALAADPTVKPTPPASANGVNPFSYGLKLFLGLEGGQRYRVVVHSVLDDREKAEAVARRLNRDFDLPAPATVGDRKPGNDYWPVIINGWTTYAEARRLRDIVADMNFKLDDKPYISVENR